MNSTPSQSSDFFGKLKLGFQAFQRTMRNPTICVLTAWAVATMLAFLLTAVQGAPAPTVHDEFAYLLGADTLASGRITNPTHPMWQHFESFHIIQQPSYICKYPPAQALTLAVGQWLGHPIIGACLATGIATAALVWMLVSWLPRRYFWIVCLFAVFHPEIQIQWGQSYWGGAVALCGGSLLIGALGRLTEKMEIRLAVIAGLGIVLMANSRPFEGAVLSATVGAVLIWKLLRTKTWSPVRFAARVVLPAAIVVGFGAAQITYCNRAITGDALTMPYQVHEKTYGWNPLFVWKKAGEKPAYRHPMMQRFYELDKANNDLKFGSATDLLTVKAGVASKILKFFCGGTILIALLGLPLLLRRPRYRLALLLVIPGLVASLSTFWGWPHYSAPVAPLIILTFFACMIEIWRYTQKHQKYRKLLLVSIPVFHILWWATLFIASADSQRNSWGRHRVAIQKQLHAQKGSDLVLVRYSQQHNPHNEWVYNAADIDSAPIVWAREISSQRRKELLDYFNDRTVWIVDADEELPQLKPFVAEYDLAQQQPASQ